MFSPCRAVFFPKTSEGANELIKKGAKLVACADDILEEYEMNLKDEKANKGEDNEIEAKDFNGVDQRAGNCG